MLAFFAALVPIVASLYVGASFLIEIAERDRAARVYARIDAWYRSQHDALNGRVDAVERAAELFARRSMLLHANGVDPTYGTYTRVSRLAAPAPVLALELRRQWVLLIGAVIGVILMSLDAGALGA